MRARKALGSDNIDRLIFMCPGCNDMHQVSVGRHGAWGWNGSLENPTLEGSVLVHGRTHNIICHSFIRDGQAIFLTDCTHDKAGQTLYLPEV